MKKPILLLIALFIVAHAAAQKFTFSHSAKTYTALTGTSPINITKYTDTIPVGFTFTINGIKKDSIVVSHFWGYFYLPGNQDARFTFFGTELTGGQFSYKTEGMPGSRIFKLEAKNVGFGHDFSTQDYVNVQVWLYEANNSIEVYYGKSLIQSPDFDYYFDMKGPQVGLKNGMLSGPATSPTLTNTDTSRVVGTPANGKVYTFSVQNLSVNEYNNNPAFLITPNPASGQFLLSSNTEIIYVEVTDITGKKMDIEYIKNSDNFNVKIASLIPGIYLVTINTANGAATQKLLVQ